MALSPLDPEQIQYVILLLNCHLPLTRQEIQRLDEEGVFEEFLVLVRDGQLPQLVLRDLGHTQQDFEQGLEHDRVLIGGDVKGLGHVLIELGLECLQVIIRVVAHVCPVVLEYVLLFLNEFHFFVHAEYYLLSSRI